jgi:hypothetical protein
MSHLRRAKRNRGGRADLVTAAEIGDFVFCKEAWRLRHGLGLEPGNRAALDAGDRHHAGKAVAERVAGGAIAVGRLVGVVAVVVLLLLGCCPDDGDAVDSRWGVAGAGRWPGADAPWPGHASSPWPGRRQDGFARQRGPKGTLVIF